jgi:hypothetical protein
MNTLLCVSTTFILLYNLYVIKFIDLYELLLYNYIIVFVNKFIDSVSTVKVIIDVI